MNDWRKVVVTPFTSIRDTVRAIDASSLQIALVVDAQERLLGTITDGDIRRGILRGAGLDEAVTSIMNAHPVRANIADDVTRILELMKRLRIHQVPLEDDVGRLVGLHTIDELLKPAQRENIVVLMAGGLGTRLRPLTQDAPKPMLRIGEKPILETILSNFAESGFHRFYLSVNYKAEMIQDYFGDGSRWGVDIRYLHETTRLGTAGALSLLPERPQSPLLVMNGDIMTQINFTALVDFHERTHAAATMCVREFSHTIPYGVVRMNDNRLVSIVEKPTEKVFVSGGIYVLQPTMLDLIPNGEYFDMPSLFQKAMTRGMETVGFPIHEYWLDIGRMEDYERAHAEFGAVFQ